MKREIKGTKKNNNWIVGKAEAVEIHTACSSSGTWIYPHLHRRTLWKSIDDHIVIDLYVMEINLKKKNLHFAWSFFWVYVYIYQGKKNYNIGAYAQTILFS